MIEMLGEPKTNLPAELRVADLIAKTARVTLRDTMRVLAALDAVTELYRSDMGSVVGECTFDPSRPGPEQVAACEREFFRLTQEEGQQPAINYALRLIKSLQ